MNEKKTKYFTSTLDWFCLWNSDFSWAQLLYNYHTLHLKILFHCSLVTELAAAVVVVSRFSSCISPAVCHLCTFPWPLTGLVLGYLDGWPAVSVFGPCLLLLCFLVFIWHCLVFLCLLVSSKTREQNISRYQGQLWGSAQEPAEKVQHFRGVVGWLCGLSRDGESKGPWRCPGAMFGSC